MWNSGRGAKRDKDVDGERLVAENAELRRRNAEWSRRNDELSRRVAERKRLMKMLGGEPFTERLDQAHSLRAEERPQAEPEGSGTRKRQRSLRRGRVTTQEKLARADRTPTVLPEGFTLEQCGASVRSGRFCPSHRG